MTEITQPYRSVRRTYSWGREWLFLGNRGWKRTALSSLYQLETRKIPVREEAIRPSEERNRQWRSRVRKNSSVFARGWTNNRKDVKFQCVGVQQLVERGRKICVGEECVFPFHSEVNYGWSVRGGMDWQSCHPTPKTINCHNFPQLPSEIIKEGGWNKTREKYTWVLAPLAKGWQFPPHILILGKIMPHSI